MPVSLDDSDIVRVVNKGDAPYTIMYDSKSYKLMPDQDAFIPFPAAAVWFGDPRSSTNLGAITNERGIRTYIPDRETEVRRLRAKYDNQFGDETKIIRHPVIEMYAITGERVTTVLEDPAGEEVTAAATTVSDQNNLMALIVAQQKQIEQLTHVVMGQGTGDVAPDETETGAETPPEQPPTAEELSTALAGDQGQEQDQEPPTSSLGGEIVTDDMIPSSESLPPQSQP